MSTLLLSAKLNRADGTTPWGFRMHGGKDFGAPLTIQRVTPGSLGANCGLKVGDNILRIGDFPVDLLTHKEAQAHIMGAGNFLELTLQRRATIWDDPSDPQTHGNLKSSGSPAPPRSPMAAGRAYSPSPLATGQPAFQPSHSPTPQDHNRSAAPFPNPGNGNIPMAVNSQYNTPINMYSVDNTMNTLAAQTGAMHLGAPSQGTAGLSTGNNPSHGMTHACSDSPVTSHTKSNNDSISLSSELKFTDAYKPPTETWTVAPDSSLSKSAVPSASAALAEEETDCVGDLTYSTSPTYRRISPSHHHPHRNPPKGRCRKVTPVPKDIDPASRKALISSRFEDVKEGEEIRYYGYTNPSAQSSSFKVLQEKLDRGEDPIPPWRTLNGSASSVSTSLATPSPVSSSTAYTPSPTSSNLRGPRPWRPSDYTSSSGPVKIAAPKFKATAPVGKWSPTLNQSPKQNPNYSGSPGQDVLGSSSGGIKSSPEITQSPDRGSPSTNTYSISSGAHGSEPTTTTRATSTATSTAMESQSSARWLLGGLRGGPNDAPRPDESRANQVMDSDEIQYVDVKIKPGPRTTLGPSQAPAGRLSPAVPARAASPRGLWQPQVPTGPRKMRFIRPSEVRSMPSAGVGVKVPICDSCGIAIRGPFVLALNKSWCPDHFNCSNPHCRAPLIGIGFVEEAGQLFCEKDYEKYFAPRCGKCGNAIMRECVNALKDTFHPECFLCFHCGGPIGSGSFHVEDGKNYCEKDWAAMFQTKCYGCQFPIEPGDRWVEALNANWHSECFNCSTCQVNLEGQGFYAKDGKPYCKKHASTKRF